MAQDMKKVKCELCDGKGWYPTIRSYTIDRPGGYACVLKSFRQTCSWCNGKGEIPPMEEKEDDQ